MKPGLSHGGPRGHDGRVESFGVPDGQRRAGPRRRRDDRVGLLDRSRQRLLHQHRDAALEEQRRDLGVRPRSARQSTPGRPARAGRARSVQRRAPAPAAISARPRLVDVDHRRRASRPSIDDRMRAWCRPRWPTPTTAALRTVSLTPSSRLGRPAARPTMAMPASSAARIDVVAVEQQRRARRRPTAPSRPRPASPRSSATPTTGTSKRMSWFGLATLTIARAGARQPPGPRDHLVGALHGLDGDDGGALHDDGLADVEAGDLRPPCDSRTRSRRAPRPSAAARVSTPGARQQRRQERRRVDAARCRGRAARRRRRR